MAEEAEAERLHALHEELRRELADKKIEERNRRLRVCDAFAGKNERMHLHTAFSAWQSEIAREKLEASRERPRAMLRAWREP